MKENLKSIYVWVELPKRSMPNQFEEILESHLKYGGSSSFDSDYTYQVFTIDNESYFVRSKALYKNGKYYFSCFTGGWFHLNYKLYLEVDLSRNITPCPFPNEIELKEVDNYLLTELSIMHENKVIIEGKEYCLRFSRVLPAQDCFEFVSVGKPISLNSSKKYYLVNFLIYIPQNCQFTDSHLGYFFSFIFSS